MDYHFDSDTDAILSQFNDTDSLEDFDMKQPRFAPPVDDKDVTACQESGKSKNTTKDTAWVLKVFNDWRKSRNDSIMKEAGSSTSSFVPGLNRKCEFGQT